MLSGCIYTGTSSDTLVQPRVCFESDLDAVCCCFATLPPTPCFDPTTPCAGLHPVLALLMMLVQLATAPLLLMAPHSSSSSSSSSSNRSK
jgi:hypothetical protein